MTFLETPSFTRAVSRFLSDEALAKLQLLLMENPTAGDVMLGCGGIRKIRVADIFRGKGKRGGVRVIYLHIPRAKRIHFLEIFGKTEKEDLSPKERQGLWKLAELYQRQAIATYERWLKRNA